MKQFNNQSDLTAYWEGFRDKSYQDIGGVWTIGYGTIRINGSVVTSDMSCTQDEALQWLQNDLYCMVPGEYSYLSSFQLDAVRDLAYNIGWGAFPILDSFAKSQNTAGVASEFLNDIYVKGTPIIGLVLRRISEWNTFVNSQYVAWEEGDAISSSLKQLLLDANYQTPSALAMINSFTILN